MIPAAGLRTRLGRLPGAPPGFVPDAADRPSRSAELEQLLRRVESMRSRSRASATGTSTAADVAKQLGGREASPGLIVVDRCHPFWQPFGRRTLGQWIASASEAVGTLLATSPDKLLFIDTETSGLAGGTGTIAWMIGIARIEARTVLTRQYVINGFAAERELLAALRREVGPDTTLVSFNGRSFDLPLLTTRLKLNRLDPLPPACHLDLLHPLRRRFRGELPDCRLQTLEERVLGRPRENDVAGAAAPAIWNAILAGHEHRQLEGMAQHNRIDLLAMVALLHVVETI